MLEKLLIAGISVLVSSAFYAGVSWSQFKRTRGDVNGLGRKVNRMERCFLAFCPENQRKEIAQFLESGKLT